jgi:hypothetical protein
MSRSDRALCRIMRSHGKSYQDIAAVMNQSMGIVGAAIKNSYLRPDDAGERPVALSGCSAFLTKDFS